MNTGRNLDQLVNQYLPNGVDFDLSELSLNANGQSLSYSQDPASSLSSKPKKKASRRANNHLCGGLVTEVTQGGPTGTEYRTTRVNNATVYHDASYSYHQSASDFDRPYYPGDSGIPYASGGGMYGDSLHGDYGDVHDPYGSSGSAQVKWYADPEEDPMEGSGKSAAAVRAKTYRQRMKKHEKEQQKRLDGMTQEVTYLKQQKEQHRRNISALEEQLSVSRVQ